MQDLKHYEDMNWALMRGDIKQGAFRNIVEFATTLHRVTHKKYCPEEEFEVMKQTFRYALLVDGLNQMLIVVELKK